MFIDPFLGCLLLTIIDPYALWGSLVCVPFRSANRGIETAYLQVTLPNSVEAKSALTFSSGFNIQTVSVTLNASQPQRNGPKDSAAHIPRWCHISICAHGHESAGILYSI